MNTRKIQKNIYLVDLETAGIKNFIASYILKGKNTTIIESGPVSTVQNLLSGLEELSIKPEEVAYVALSHIHLDHAGGAGTLLNQLPKAKLVVHRRGAPHIASPEKLWTQSMEALGSIAEEYGEPEPVPTEKIIAVNDDRIIDVGDDIKLKVVETLGHASHHISYYETASHGLFVGDAAGIYLKSCDAIVPTTPSPFRLDIALASLEKLVKLEPRSAYYSHFGNASKAVEKIQCYAKQLKLWAEKTKRGIERNESLEAIRTKIMANDASLQKALEYIKNHPILSKTVLIQSIKGFTEFSRKFRHFSM